MPVGNQTALVERIKAELVAKGKTFATNEDAFEITARVAWALRDQGAKLIPKNPGQNGATWGGRRFSHDALVFPDGWVDLLASAGPPANENRPVWQWTDGVSSGGVEPFDLDAGVVTPDPEPEPEPDPSPSVPLPDLIAIIQSAVETSMIKRLKPILSALEDIKDTQDRGLGGTVIGYKVRLKP